MSNLLTVAILAVYIVALSYAVACAVVGLRAWREFLDDRAEGRTNSDLWRATFLPAKSDIAPIEGAVDTHLANLRKGRA